jgi:hypothetical protein
MTHVNRLLLGAAMALTAALTAAPGLADPFTLMIWEHPDQIALRIDAGPDGQAYWGGYMAFAEAAGAAEVLRGGSALMTDATVTVTSGAAPGASGPLVLGGYFQIDVPDLAAARDWAARLPAAETGAIVIHPGYPAPGM